MSTEIFHLPIEDHKLISWHLKNFKEMYEGSEILLYGGTGFIGCWITESLVYADIELNLGLKITIVTRNIKLAKLKFSNFVNSKINFIEHNFVYSPLKIKINSDYIFCGATPTRNYNIMTDKQAIFSASRNSAMHASQSESSNFKSTRVIHLSSGIVYGKQPMEMLTRSENDIVVSGSSVYAQAKLEIDKILNSAYNAGKIIFQSPRLFAFTGPNLQLDSHFAVGNFLLNGLRGEPIVINGNPATIRSYMYPADLIKSLLSLAIQSNYININIGSEDSISMLQLAKLISEITSNSEIILANPNVEPSNYVPSTRNLLDLFPDTKFIDIKGSLLKWTKWLQIKDTSL